MTRPDPSGLIPGLGFSDPSAAQATLGNPALRPYFSNSIDAGMDLYTGNEGLFELVAFRKSVSGFTAIQTTVRPFSALAQYGVTYDTLTPTQQMAISARGGPAAASVQILQQANTPGPLTVNGLEATYVQPLDFILDRYGLAGFGLTANLTIIDTAPRHGDPVVATGISPYSYNLTAYYENHGLRLLAAYVFNDKQMTTGTNQNGICLPDTSSISCPRGAYVFNDAYAQLDLSANVKLSAFVGPIVSDPELVFNIKNLTQAKLRSYFQYKQAVMSYYAPGSQYLFAIRGSF
jgi:TonB dependent receptor.